MPTKISFDKSAAVKNVFREFSSWVHWDQRGTLRDPTWDEPMSGYPGVYLLAHFETPPSGAADYLASEIVYVGEGSHLGRRWRQFDGSARRGAQGHSGGFSYRDEFGSRTWGKLFLAALPIWFGGGYKSLGVMTESCVLG